MGQPTSTGSRNAIMESSPTSNQSINDKPDELVSSRADVHASDEPQASSVYGSQQGLQSPQQQPPQQQAQNAQPIQLQKKCSHHRMFDSGPAGSMVNERIAAFTNAVLQRVGQQAQAQAQTLSQMFQVSTFTLNSGFLGNFPAICAGIFFPILAYFAFCLGHLVPFCMHLHGNGGPVHRSCFMSRYFCSNARSRFHRPQSCEMK